MMVMISNVSAFNERSVFDETNENSKWMFIEKKFITDIHAKKESIWTHLSTIAPAAAIAFSGYGYLQIPAKKEADAPKVEVSQPTKNTTATNTNSSTESTKEAESTKEVKAVTEIKNIDFIQSLLTPQNVYTILGLSATALLVVQYLECELSSRANRNAVEDFFNNWEENQFYVPAELKEAFDAIAEMIELQGQEAVLKKSDEIVNAIKYITTRQLSRYSKSLEISACNTLGNVKTIGEIFKNAIETGGKLAGGK